jgi:hypothetical protein
LAKLAFEAQKGNRVRDAVRGHQWQMAGPF